MVEHCSVLPALSITEAMTQLISHNVSTILQFSYFIVMQSLDYHTFGGSCAILGCGIRFKPTTNGCLVSGPGDFQIRMWMGLAITSL